MILGIDTSEMGKTRVYLKDKNGKLVKDLTEERKSGSQVLLPMIVKILKLTKKNLQNLQKIEVNCGPGSFTGLRVGVSVANALGFSLKIPVNDRKIGELVFPKYD